jgi:hypothetical protein
MKVVEQKLLKENFSESEPLTRTWTVTFAIYSKFGPNNKLYKNTKPEVIKKVYNCICWWPGTISKKKRRVSERSFHFEYNFGIT